MAVGRPDAQPSVLAVRPQSVYPTPMATKPPAPSPPSEEEALDVLADVVGDVAAGFAKFGKTDIAEKIKKGEAALRSGAELKKKLPEVLRAAGVTYENSSFARLERLLREKGVVSSRPSHGGKR